MLVSRLLVLFVLFTPVCLAATVYVPDHFATIQGAINASVGGDVVIVRDGTYVENLRFIGHEIVLRSENGPQLTAIDGGCRSAVILIENGEGPGAVVEGFTITNGDCARGGGIRIEGAGALRPSPTIVNNIITGNRASECGGGLYSSRGTPSVEGNRFVNNTSAAKGGAIYAERASVFVTANRFSGNSAPQGGAIHLYACSSGAIERNDFSKNRSSQGGALYCNLSSPDVVDNLVVGNEADGDGGGLYLVQCSSQFLSSNVVSGNRAGSYGGGIYCHYHSDPTFRNNVVSDNSAFHAGGGFALGWYTVAVVAHNTIAGNDAFIGGGIRCEGWSDVTVANTILWKNTAVLGPAIHADSTSPATVTCSDVEGGWGGTGNIDLPPLFADSTAGDFHLTLPSPCRDSADGAASAAQYDFEGDPRHVGSEVDMGADEFAVHLYTTGAVRPGLPLQVKVVGAPGQPVLLGMGSAIENPPLSTRYGLLHLKRPFSGVWGLSPVRPNGLSVTSIRVPPSWVSGDAIPFQALVGPMSGPATKLTNLLLLEVE